MLADVFAEQEWGTGRSLSPRQVGLEWKHKENGEELYY